jgi:hypothetical protein
MNSTTLYAFEEAESDDIVTPNFPKQKKAGNIINNPCTITNTILVSVPCKAEFLVRYNSSPWENGPYTSDAPYFIKGKFVDPNYGYSHIVNQSPTLPVHPDRDSVVEEALQSAYKKMDSSPMMGLVTIAELHKTVALLRLIMLRIIRLSKNKALMAFLTDGALDLILKTPKGKSAKKIANEWLQFRYGIMQLVYDAESAYKAAVAAMEKSPRNRAVVQRALPTRQLLEVGTWSDYSPPAPWHATLRHIQLLDYLASYEVNERATIRAGILWASEVQGVPDRIASAFGLKQALPTMWELTKFSFILDWVWDVGSALAAMEASVKNNVLASWVVDESEVIRKYSHKVRLKPELTGTLFKFDYSDWLKVATADISSEDGITSLYVKTYSRSIQKQRFAFVPQFKLKLNAPRVLDLVAIATQLLFNRKR